MTFQMTAVVPKQLGKQVEIFQGGSSLSREMSLKCVHENGCDLVGKYCDFPMGGKMVVIVYPPGYLEEQLAQSLLTYLM